MIRLKCNIKQIASKLKLRQDQTIWVKVADGWVLRASSADEFLSAFPPLVPPPLSDQHAHRSVVLM